MPIYLWRGEDRKGIIQKGEVEADDQKAAEAQVRRMNIRVTKIKKKPKDLFENVGFLQPRVRNADVVVFARQFATMINAGLPLIQCLDILQAQQENKTFKTMLKDIKESVESGSTLADALGKYPAIFDDLFANMVAAGETAGILDTILNRLSEYMEKAQRLKKQVKSAMTYPIIVLVVAVLVISVILVFVIPVFKEMFEDFGGALPVPTQIVVNMSEFVQSNILYVIVGIVIFVFLFRKFYATEKGRAIVDNYLLKIPIFGALLRKVAVAKFTRTLGTMVGSGVPILDALNITAKTSGNKTVETAIMKTRSAISEGQTMAAPLGETGVFPSMVCQMVAVGESTGALDSMLAKIADYYDEEVDAAVATLTSMIEPFMMVFLGATIGGLVIAMYLPIFQMAGAIGG
ncbi:MAG: type II secretion system F family protein [Thermodesulfobacteriota bacterium]|nr:type II secretion system F family protein [Thermodesulfobacteriota bacterium]